MRALALSLAALAAILGMSTTASSQNYDGTHHIVRVGVFYMPHKVTSDLSIGANAPLGISQVSHTGGIVAGIEWIRPGWRYGVEFDLAPLSGHSVVPTGEVAVNFTGSLRGRIAVDITKDWRIYGTLGIAALGLETRHTVAGNLKQSDTKAGFIVGGGLERDWSHVTLFGELLHTSYGNNTLTLGGTDYAYRNLGDTSLRLGIKFKVGHDYGNVYHDDVRERLK